jgi:hypothetical protein
MKRNTRVDGGNKNVPPGMSQDRFSYDNWIVQLPGIKSGQEPRCPPVFFRFRRRKKISNIARMEDLQFSQGYRAPEKCPEGTPLKRKYPGSENVYFAHSNDNSGIFLVSEHVIRDNLFTRFLTLNRSLIWAYFSCPGVKSPGAQEYRTDEPDRPVKQA